jgi:transposase
LIRIDALWRCTQLQDTRARAEQLMAQVIHASAGGGVHPIAYIHAPRRASAHHGYLFANTRATRIKLLVYDGFGLWCAARRLNAERFVWPREIDASKPLALTRQQFDALVVGHPLAIEAFPRSNSETGLNRGSEWCEADPLASYCGISHKK